MIGNTPECRYGSRLPRPAHDRAANLPTLMTAMQSSSLRASLIVLADAQAAQL